MPDQHGKLTAEDTAKVAKWWTGRWKSPVVCPVCKTSDWTLAPHLVGLHRLAVDPLSETGEVYHMILVGCRNCAHTMTFNAVQVGLSEPHSDWAQTRLPQIGDREDGR